MVKKPQAPRRQTALDRIMAHFEGHDLETLSTVEKVFPVTVQPDMETALTQLLPGAVFAGVSGRRSYETLTFSYILNEQREPPIIAAPQYLDIDIGEQKNARAVASGLWFFAINDHPMAVLLAQVGQMEHNPGVQVQVIASEPAGGHAEAQAILAALSTRLSEASVYRGKALSFATTRHYMGGLGALKIHRLPRLGRDDVILSKTTLETLDRTVFQFIATRQALAEKGFSTKRGLLLYGPPGTGKTHFIRYLLGHLEGHTSLLVTAEQVAFFEDVMGIARALQPSVVVIEDADLLAGAREDQSACGQVLLNSLLNHMDGLTDDAEILFILTTNRPETLEAAVRDRPGRIDQAIEVPLPDADCRSRLLKLYCAEMPISDDACADCVRRTDGASAAFMREVARRMAQFALARNARKIQMQDLQAALGDMVADGSFTARALGAEAITQT
ncbi:MAG: AAA family ATPase [Pseudomonadota bacterium]